MQAMRGLGVSPTMIKEIKLVKKVKCLLRRLGYPRWLHRFGPKTYEFFEHVSALLVRSFCQLSYRRVKQLFDLLDICCPSKSSLQYTAAKLSAGFWQKILQLTSGSHYLIALDSTGFSRTNPSYHYLRRINGAMPKVPVKASIAFDTRKKKFCAAKIRLLPAADIRDEKYLLIKSKACKAVADKAYLSEAMYKYAYQQKIILMIPTKKNAKRGFYRKIMQKHFRLRTYHRRALIESANSSIKRKYGTSVTSKKARTIRTEIYSRMACHNIFLLINRLLGQSRKGA